MKTLKEVQANIVKEIRRENHLWRTQPLQMLWGIFATIMNIMFLITVFVAVAILAPIAITYVSVTLPSTTHMTGLNYFIVAEFWPFIEILTAALVISASWSSQFPSKYISDAYPFLKLKDEEVAV